MDSINTLGKNARRAETVLSGASAEAKNAALTALAKALCEKSDFII